MKGGPVIGLPDKAAVWSPLRMLPAVKALMSAGQTLMDSFRATKTEKIYPRMLMDTSKALGGDLWNVLTTHEERTRSKSKNRLFFR
jgi:hypothetical protein